MVESDYFPVLIPVILSIIASAIFMAITRFSKTSEGTLKGTLRIEHVQTDMIGLKKDVREGFIKLEALINIKDEENRRELEKLREKLELIESENKLHAFRIQLLEKERTK